MSGERVRMVIESHALKDFSDDKGGVKKFIIPVNPETFTKNYKVEYETKKSHGRHGTKPRFKSTAPEELKIEFILDGTNTIQGYEYDGLFKDPSNEKIDIKEKKPKDELVNEQLHRFLEAVYFQDGEIHRPRNCKITWGVELFKGVLKNLDINYTLFHANGKPLRIKITATFLDFVAQEERAKRAKLKSPDLTRIRTVKAGESLEGMVHKFYSDSKFIVQVARANELTSFRSDLTGLELRFPPVKKEI